MEVVLGLIIGLALGGVTVGLILRSHIRTIESQKQTINDKVELYTSQRAQLSQEVDAQKEEIRFLNQTLREKEQELRAIIQRSSDANAKIEQFSDLKQRLQDKEQENIILQSSNTSLKEEISKLKTKLEDKEQDFNRRINELEKCLQQAHININENISLKELNSRLETELKNERRTSEENLELLENTQQRLSDTFRALSADALQNNNQQFIELAKATLQQEISLKQQAIENLFSPLNRSLEVFNQQIREAENARLQDKGQISEQLKSLAAAQSQLQTETANLTKALRQPTVRGRWGEMQLQRVVEMAGMQEHCDFKLQETIRIENDVRRCQRPDLVVKLPNNKEVVVDSKAPMEAYLQAVEAQEESSQIEHLRNHARQIRNHINSLSSDNYWRQFEQSPEFVVMFLPGEVFFSAALQQDPRLIEYGIEKKIILATPTTLISLLKTVAYGWQQEKIAKNAREVSNLGRELYDRFTIFAGHLVTVRKKLDATVKAYNDSVASFESRLLVTARKFQEIGGYGVEEIESLELIDRSTRCLAREANENGNG